MSAWLIPVVWWLVFRKTQDWKTILLFWLGGVLAASVLLAVLMSVFNADKVFSSAVLGMPLGGLVALVYGAVKGQLKRDSGLFSAE